MEVSIPAGRRARIAADAPNPGSSVALILALVLALVPAPAAHHSGSCWFMMEQPRAPAVLEAEPEPSVAPFIYYVTIAWGARLPMFSGCLPR